MTTDSGEVMAISVLQLDEHYSCFRLTSPKQNKEMQRSMARHGQLTPVVATWRDESLAVVDGFKRMYAARELGYEVLMVRTLDLSDEAAVAALYTLNALTHSLNEFEEALVVRHLCRDKGLSQVEVGQILGRHKSWVSRRLGLVERLSEEVQNDLRVGLTSVTVARELTRLPRGNQSELMAAIHQQGLTTREACRLIILFESAQGREQQRYLLDKPREALEAQEKENASRLAYDPRLSKSANSLRRRLYKALDLTAELPRTLRQCWPLRWTERERRVLAPLLLQVSANSSVLYEVLDEGVAVLESGASDG